MIRPATNTDIPHIIRMGRHFWAQTALKDIVYCPDSIAYSCREMMASGLLLIAEVDGVVAGAVGALACPLYANRAYLVASELFWWVEPEFRDKGVGIEMLLWIEQAAKDQGVHIFGMMALDAVEPEKADGIYRKFGYAPGEHSYLKVF